MSRSKNADQLPGVLEVICGPMFSGKSEELMRRIRRAKIAQQKVLNLKHQLDNRHAIEYIVSHDGNKVQAIPFENAQQLITITQEENIDVIGIDEAQFFSKDIVPVICQLVNSGTRIIVAGLDLDFKGSPFGCMPLLLAIADKVLKLQAICTQCGHDANYTQRLVNGKPAKHNDPIVLIGAQESYQARCRSCYSIDKMPTF